MTIKAGVLRPEELFGRPVRYVVPPYQRPYVWEQDKQWQPLWEDVEDLAERYLEATKSGTKQILGDELPSHFLGAVVLQQESVPAGHIETRHVIDGQQRLTTLQLLMDSAQEVMEKNHPEGAEELLEFVENKRRYTRANPIYKYKVWPTLNDVDDFVHAMTNDNAATRPDDSLIVDAHDYFRNEILAWFEELEVPNEIQGQALVLVLTQMLRLVVIDLDANAEPQVVFETLNARGTPLRQSDLVRNYMILKARNEGLDSNEFNEQWLAPFSTPWWEEELRFGAINRMRFDQFMYYWVTMRTLEDIRVDRVFDRFRQFVDESSVGVEEIAKDIKRCADVYRDIELAERDGPYGKWHSYLSCRAPLSIGLDAPLVMWLLVEDIEESERARVFRALESWFVRRILWGRRSTGVDGVILALLTRLQRLSAGESLSQSVVDFFANHTNYLMVWTSDEEFFGTLSGFKTYGRLARPRVAFLLERLEAWSSKDAEAVTLRRDLHIEHIMPRRWERHWPLTGETHRNYPDPRDYRNVVVNLLGNLTLLTSTVNTSVSNGPWRQKKREVGDSSVLFLNKDILKHGEGGWTTEQILDRSERLAKLALEIWPGPDKF
ncbi:MAG: DUF262 domain-containing protein [Chloroflexi bacterium]|nr:DUF262 domain-containing protein [Chloroflexota bacterium]